MRKRTPDEIRAFVREHKVQILPKKASWLMRACAWFLYWTWINRDFMDRYTTTVGKKIYYRESWGDFDINSDTHVRRHASTLEHEFVHVLQYKKWWLLYQFTYLLVFLPLGLAWFRFYWEREAYQVNRLYGRNIESCVDALWSYGWPWPRSRMRKWFENHPVEDTALAA